MQCNVLCSHIYLFITQLPQKYFLSVLEGLQKVVGFFRGDCIVTRPRIVEIWGCSCGLNPCITYMMVAANGATGIAIKNSSPSFQSSPFEIKSIMLISNITQASPTPIVPHTAHINPNTIGHVIILSANVTFFIPQF